MNIIGAGLILVLIGGIGYLSWTRPRRSYEPKDYSLATIRMSQAAIAVGVALTVLGIAGTLLRWIF
jgi:hypothetical protein